MGKKFTTVDAKERLELAKICIDKIHYEIDILKEDLESAINLGYYEIEDKESGRNEGPNCASFKELFEDSVIYASCLHEISVDYHVEKFREIIKGKIDDNYKNLFLNRIEEIKNDK